MGSDKPSPRPEAAQDAGEKATRGGKGEPQEQLPTDRIAFDKQVRLLLAYAAASDGGQSPVNNDDVGKVVEMNASTVSLANAFFVRVGFLTKSGRGYLPSREVVEFANAYAWNPDEAGQKLFPIIEKSWFWLAVKPKLHLRTVTEDEAIADLAQKAMIGPEYRPQLKMLVSYLLLGEVIRRDGDRLAMSRRGPEPARAPEPSGPSEQTRHEPPPVRTVNKSAGQDLSHLHPFVQGLLVTLPREGDEWPAAERANWLQLAEGVFRVIYKGGGTVSIKADD